MPNWKKVIVSGSDARLNSLFVTNAVTASYGKFTKGATLTGSLLVTQSHISTVDYIDFTTNFTTTATPPFLTGRLHWTDDTKTLNIDTDINGFSIEIGHQNAVRVRNTNTFTLTKGIIVYINGESGQRPTVATASWTDDTDSATTLGFVAQNISAHGTGYVITNGLIRGINTTAFVPGTMLYLSASGQYTSTIPIAPFHSVRLGRTITQAVDGTIYVNVMNGYKLGELHDVLEINRKNGDLIIFDSSSRVYRNSKILSGSYGVSGSLNVSNGITGSLFGSSSYSTVAKYVTHQYFATFTQSIASTSWTFDHNLSQRVPVVTVYDNDYNVIIPKNIRGASSNQLIISFDSPISGYASATIGSILPINQESLALAYSIVL